MSFLVSPILSITTNQRPLPLIQKPLKHPAAPDTLATVHAAQGHQRTAAARTGFAAWLIHGAVRSSFRSPRAAWASRRTEPAGRHGQALRPLLAEPRTLQPRHLPSRVNMRA